MPMTIRPAELRDLEAIAAIANAAVEGGVAHFGTEPSPVAEFEAEWAGGRSGYPWFVAADEGGAVLGYAKAGPWKSRGAYRWTTEIGVYIRDDARGRGIGRALYERLFPELERRGYRTVIAGMTMPNDASQRLHESMGMAHVGVFPRNGFKHGAWHDVAYYVLNFGSAEDAPDAARSPGAGAADPLPHQ
ncbi:MAG: hypothetical phosphinothricin N-acetyltransferase [Phycisphaeraceae bacterium]|nr:MAG: hypothetical phosphinothricin N-acetyltransferase [Phycisphaeraceae bacterium]